MSYILNFITSTFLVAIPFLMRRKIIRFFFNFIFHTYVPSLVCLDEAAIGSVYSISPALHFRQTERAEHFQSITYAPAASPAIVEQKNTNASPKIKSNGRKIVCVFWVHIVNDFSAIYDFLLFSFRCHRTLLEKYFQFTFPSLPLTCLTLSADFLFIFFCFFNNCIWLVMNYFFPLYISVVGSMHTNRHHSACGGRERNRKKEKEHTQSTLYARIAISNHCGKIFVEFFIKIRLMDFLLAAEYFSGGGSFCHCSFNSISFQCVTAGWYGKIGKIHAIEIDTWISNALKLKGEKKLKRLGGCASYYFLVDWRKGKQKRNSYFVYTQNEGKTFRLDACVCVC